SAARRAGADLTEMDEFKRDNFAKEYPGRRFPDVEEVESSQVARIRTKLAAIVEAKSSEPSAELTCGLSKRQRLVQGVNAELTGFSLRQVFEQENLLVPERVLINWHWFERLDRVASEDLVRYFDDFWYPAADDIEIFDEDLSWILSVHHYGAIW